MNKFKYPFILAAFLILIGGAFAYRLGIIRPGSSVSQSQAVYYCPMHPTYTSDKPGDCPICNMKLVKKEEAETHSHEDAGQKAEPKVMTLAELKKMKPGQICLLHKCKMGTCMMAMTDEMARLGKCPHCGEDLNVIIKDLIPQGYSHVNLPPQKQEMIGLKTAPAKKIKMTKIIRASGRVAYDPELYQAQEEYLEIIKPYRKSRDGDLKKLNRQATKLIDSARLKLKVMGLSNDLISEIEKTGKPDRTLIYSEAGAKVWLYFPVYEYELPLVKAGQKVEAEIAAIPGKKMEGTVRSIDSVLDPVTRSVRVRAVLDNPDGILKPEMYVNTLLQSDLGEALTVPEEAVFSTGEKNIVFVIRSGDMFEPREVTPGVSSEGVREIKAGLAEGDNVVVSGNFLIDSESRLKGALEGMGGEGGHQHGG